VPRWSVASPRHEPSRDGEPYSFFFGSVAFASGGVLMSFLRTSSKLSGQSETGLLLGIGAISSSRLYSAVDGKNKMRLLNTADRPQKSRRGIPRLAPPVNAHVHPKLLLCFDHFRPPWPCRPGRPGEPHQPCTGAPWRNFPLDVPSDRRIDGDSQGWRHLPNVHALSPASPFCQPSELVIRERDRDADPINPAPKFSR
jgi:hypothetical protein